MSICSDGWLDAQRKPLITIMVVSEGKSVALKTLNYEGETKDKHFIVDPLINTIQEIDPQKVVQVITCCSLQNNRTHHGSKVSAYLLDPLYGSYSQSCFKEHMCTINIPEL